jgi:NCAIR mutase (PurE)-related protein
MNAESLRRLLSEVREGRLEVSDAVERLRDLPFEDLGDTKIDHHRALRTGMPEAIFSQGKTPQQVAEAFAALAGKGSLTIATRAGREVFEAVRAAHPEAVYHERARIISLGSAWSEESPAHGQDAPCPYVAIATGGTADLPVAEEAAVTLELLGHRVERLFDVGVAGIHRLLAHRQVLYGAAVVIVVAGMEGALASVVSGLVSAPLVAVPTSVGYGANFGGLAPLLAMLNSCAPGVAVVNIDNGFGAAAFAHLVVASLPVMGDG